MQSANITTRRKARSGSRQVHRLMDQVYRGMYLLEAGRPGAEVALALALLRARVAADGEAEKHKDWEWLRPVLPICLKMIDESLDRGGTVASLLRGISTHPRES